MSKHPVVDKYAVYHIPEDIREMGNIPHHYKLLKMEFSIGEHYWTWAGGDSHYSLPGCEHRLHKGNPIRRKFFDTALEATQAYSIGMMKRMENLESSMAELRVERIQFSVEERSGHIYEGVE